MVPAPDEPSRPLGQSAAVALVAANAVVLAGAAVVLAGRPRWVGLYGYVALAVVVVDLVTVLRRRSLFAGTTDPIALLPTGRRAVATLLATSATALALLGRGTVFYAVLTAAVVLLLVRLQTTDADALAAPVEAGLACAASVLVLAAQVLPQAYYVAQGDTVKHNALVAAVAREGTAGALPAALAYSDFPAYHVLVAATVRLTGLPARVAAFLVVAAGVQAAALFVYGVVRRWTGSTTDGLTALALVGVNFNLLFFGVRSHPQTLSLVLFSAVVFLLVATARRNRRRTVPAVALVGSVWVVTHHLSVFMGLSLLSVPVGVAAALRRWSWGGYLDADALPYGPGSAGALAVVGVVFVTYWTLLTATVAVPIVWVLYYSPGAVGAPSRLVVERVDDLGPLVAEAAPFFVDNLHYSFVAVLAVGGAWRLVGRTGPRSRRAAVLLAGAAPAAVLYFPNPAWIPLRGVGTLLRWGVMTLPLLAVFPALGLAWVFAARDGGPVHAAVAVALAVALVFAGVGAGLSDPTLTDLAGYDKEADRTLTRAELSGLSFARSRPAADRRVYAPFGMHAHLLWYRWLAAAGSTPAADGKPATVYPYGVVAVGEADGRLLFADGLTVVPRRKLATGAVRVRVRNASAYYAGTDVETLGLSATVSGAETRWSPGTRDVVYANPDVVVVAEAADGSRQSGGS